MHECRILVGGIGYRWQRDGSFGVVACDALAEMTWPPEVTIADLGYGAIYAAQDIGDAQPPYDRAILIAAVERNRDPGRLYSYRYDPQQPTDEELLERIREAGAGVISLDHLLTIATHMRALPADVTVVELEPVDTTAGIELSETGARLLTEALAVIKHEVDSRHQAFACRR